MAQLPRCTSRIKMWATHFLFVSIYIPVLTSNFLPLQIKPVILFKLKQLLNNIPESHVMAQLCLEVYYTLREYHLQEIICCLSDGFYFSFVMDT